MQKFVILCAAMLLAAAGCDACAGSYTHSRGLLAEEAKPEACQYTHMLAGRDWAETDAECKWSCGGASQSPIDVPAEAEPLPAELRADTNFGKASNLTVLNVGHAIQVEFNAPTESTAAVSVCGGSIYGLYNGTADDCTRVNVEALQFHFHSTSEHLLDGRSSQLELHIVTKLAPTADQVAPKECQGEKPCLAVFGVLYDLSVDEGADAEGDARIQRIIEALPAMGSPACPEAGTGCRSPMSGSLDLSELLPGTDAPGYYAYTGSLTTPPCTQGVMWHVFGTIKATLTEAQAIDLQSALATAVHEGHEVANRLNNRETQPLNGRTVFSA